MASKDAENVAKQVLETIGSGKKVIMGEIIRQNGYSPNTSLTPKLVTETESYQAVVQPIVARWQREITRIQKELEGRELSDEKYKDLVDSMDKLNKQVQLATGGVTERLGIQMSIEERLLANKALENSDE